MPRRVLDTSVLCSFWNMKHGDSKKRAVQQNPSALAKELIEMRGSDSVVTPVIIEFIAGARTGDELERMRQFLNPFTVIDGGKVTEADWRSAKRYAERVPRDGNRRQLGDCIIKAVCARLNYEVDTTDKRFPR